MKKINKDGNLKRMEVNYEGSWKEKGWSAIPNIIFVDDNLGKNEKLVYCVLSIHAMGNKKECYPSIQTISKEAGISRNTIYKALENLEDENYISINHREGRPNLYTLKVKKLYMK